MRSLWLLNELKLEYELITLSFDREIFEASYLAIHPLGRVPCLVDGDLTLMESAAICQYLCQRYDNNHLGREAGHPEWALWLQWLHFAETIAVHASNLVQQYLVITDEKKRSPLVQKLERRRLQKTLEMVDQKLANQNYLLPGGFSAADISVGYSIHLGQYLTDIAQFPRLQDYYQRLKERPAFQRSLPQAGDNKRIFSSTDRYWGIG